MKLWSSCPAVILLARRIQTFGPKTCCDLHQADVMTWKAHLKAHNYLPNRLYQMSVGNLHHTQSPFVHLVGIVGIMII